MYIYIYTYIKYVYIVLIACRLAPKQPQCRSACSHMQVGPKVAMADWLLEGKASEEPKVAEDPQEAGNAASSPK